VFELNSAPIIIISAVIIVFYGLYPNNEPRFYLFYNGRYSKRHGRDWFAAVADCSFGLPGLSNLVLDCGVLDPSIVLFDSSRPRFEETIPCGMGFGYGTPQKEWMILYVISGGVE
jgi:hypothetical protein